MTGLSTVHMVTEAWKETLRQMWHEWEKVEMPLGKRRMLHGSEDDQEPQTDNPLWELARLMPYRKRFGSRIEVDVFPGMLREHSMHLDALRRMFSYAIVSPSDLEMMKTQMESSGYDSLVEIGAGTGYWSWQMEQMGFSVDAYDERFPGSSIYTDPVMYTDVKIGKEDKAEVDGKALMLVWPPADDMAANCLKRYQGDLLFFCGEPHVHVNADNEFYRVLSEGWVEADFSEKHVSYYGLYSALWAYRRV